MSLIDMGYDFDDVLIVPNFSNISSRKDVNLERKFEFKNGRSITCVPIAAANMDTVGTIEMSKHLSKHKMLTFLHKHYSIEVLTEFFKEEQNRKYTFFTMGCSEKEYEKYAELDNLFPGAINVCIDIANGYIDSFYSFVSKVRNRHTKIILCAGNVITEEAVKRLENIGVNIAKIGIGPGKFCLTRAKAGVGYPQLSAIQNCVQSPDNKFYIMSDGGCNCPGDVSKAFVAGADFVMLGNMLSGHDNCGCEPVIITDERTGQEKKYYTVYGMSSDTAMKKFNGGVNWYRTSEGRTLTVESKGDIEHTIQDILGGVRSCGTYIGYKNIEDFKDGANFIRVKKILNT